MPNLTVTQIAAWQLPDIDDDLPAKQKLEWAAELPSLQRGAVWKPGKIELFGIRSSEGSRSALLLSPSS